MAMGIKCSLFGHAYGETTVERDREEDGSEVVITIREVEICRRCEETRIVSENKEVTTIETPEDVPAAGEADVGDDSTAEDSSGAGIVDAEAGEPVSGTEATGSGGGVDHPEVEDPSPDLDDAEATTAAEDDGVILEDSDEPDREPGEWPDEEADESESTDQTDESPATDGIERFTDNAETDVIDDAETDVTDDDPESVEILDEDDDPEEDTGEIVEDVETDEGATSDDGPGGDSEVWSEKDPDLSGERPGGTMTVPDGRFRCPACDFQTPVESSSLREGDFCPECHEETLVHESG